MSKHDHLEDLSAWMDNELDQDRSRFLLKRLTEQPQLHRVWARYHTARDVLQDASRVFADSDFADGVMREIAAEQAAAPQRMPRRRWRYWSMGGALAASVAALAFVAYEPGLDTSLSMDGAQNTVVEVLDREDLEDSDPVQEVAQLEESESGVGDAPLISSMTAMPAAERQVSEIYPFGDMRSGRAQGYGDWPGYMSIHPSSSYNVSNSTADTRGDQGVNPWPDSNLAPAAVRISVP